jgi:hypothetical protein
MMMFHINDLSLVFSFLRLDLDSLFILFVLGVLYTSLLGWDGQCVFQVFS